MMMTILLTPSLGKTSSLSYHRTPPTLQMKQTPTMMLTMMIIILLSFMTIDALMTIVTLIYNADDDDDNATYFACSYDDG